MRNPNGYGSVHKLTGNRRKPWRVRVTTGWSEEGKQKFANIGYFETRKEAMIALAKYNENPWDVKTDKLTFEKLFDMWVEKNEKIMEPKNLSSYKSAYKNTAAIQKMLFKEIKTLHLQNVIDGIEKGHSTKTKTKQVFSQMYKYALENDFVNKDYSQFVTVPQKEEKSSRKPFSYEKIKAAFDNPDPNYEIVLMLLFTGMRINELLKLETADIDLENRIMTGGSKTTAGKDRTIPISKFILPYVKKRFNPNNKYLIVNDKNKKVSYDVFYKWWKSNIEDHTPHDTRHTFTTIMNRIEVNDITLERIVGHKSKTITGAVYIHKSNEDLLAAMDKFDEHISKNLCI